MKKSLSTGFIDPISLISLGIVVIGLVITTFIVKNPDIKLVCMDPCQTNADCDTNEYCYRPATGCSVCKPKASPPPSSIPSPSPSPASTCNGTCVPGISCADEGLCNASGSCSGNKHCCKSCPSASPSPSPSPSPPACGHIWEECCGGYPNGSCNSGLYCSNIDGGTCITQNCTPNAKRCNNQYHQICKVDGSSWTNLNTCSSATLCDPTLGCLICNTNEHTCSGQTLKQCNSNRTGWTTIQTCTSQQTCNAASGQCVNPACGHLWEPCCGSGSCNSGLYCSNLDGGTCMTKVCHAERKCEGNILKICKADDSGWNNTTCQYGCNNNACQPKPSPSPSPSPSCGHLWEPCCGSGSCNSGLYCSNLDGGTCMTKVCHAERKCEGNILKICKADDSGWNNTTCQYGCNNNLKDCSPESAPTTPETVSKPQTEQECSGNGLWVSNHCYQEGESGGGGWIACPPMTGAGLNYWHWFKGESCQISSDAQPQTEQQCFSNGLWVGNKCYQEGESGGGGWIACPPMTGAGLNYWHWFKGKQCGKISPPASEAVNCENITPGTTRCNPDETGIQICFSGGWEKSQDCPQDNYCPANSNHCVENCTDIQEINCSKNQQSCLRGECVNQFVYFSQRDPLWANQPLPGGCTEPTMAGTMGPSICGPTVDAMLLATYVDPSYTPDSVVEEFFPNITCYGTALSQHTDLLTSLGFTITERYLSESSLIQYLENNPNTPFLLHISYTNAYGNVSGHFTLVNGVDADGNLIFQDPYFGENVTAASLPQNFEITDTIRITPP